MGLLPFMERKTVSPTQTNSYRYLWPLFAIAPLWILFANGLDIFHDSTLYALGIYLLVVMNPIVTVWLALKAKKVEVDGDNLYVSDARKEVRIPIEEIEDVREMRWLPPHWITVHLRSPSEFGEKFVFLQSWRWGAWFGAENELITELKQLARSKQPTGFIPPRPERRLFEDQ